MNDAIRKLRAELNFFQKQSAAWSQECYKSGKDPRDVPNPFRAKLTSTRRKLEQELAELDDIPVSVYSCRECGHMTMRIHLGLNEGDAEPVTVSTDEWERFQKFREEEGEWDGTLEDLHKTQEDRINEWLAKETERTRKAAGKRS